jgi:hypothetical protein
MLRFSLVELLIVVAIIAILVAMLLPAIARAKDSAKRVKCLATERELGRGMTLWASSNDNRMPIGYFYHKQYNMPIWNMQRAGQNRYTMTGVLYSDGIFRDREYWRCSAVSPTSSDWSENYMFKNWAPGNMTIGKHVHSHYVTRPSHLGVNFEWDPAVSTNVSVPGSLPKLSRFESNHTLLLDTMIDLGRIYSRHGTGIGAGYADGHGKWVYLRGNFLAKMVTLSGAGWGRGADPQAQDVWDTLDQE